MSIESRDMRGLILLFLLVIIGLALTPTVQEQVLSFTGVDINQWPDNATPYNLTGAARAIALLVPLFWVILILAVGAAGIMVWIKS